MPKFYLNYRSIFLGATSSEYSETLKKGIEVGLKLTHV